jgi:hypothetical protein
MPGCSGDVKSSFPTVHRIPDFPAQPTRIPSLRFLKILVPTYHKCGSRRPAFGGSKKTLHLVMCSFLSSRTVVGIKSAIVTSQDRKDQVTTMTSPEMKLSPCVRLFIELMVGGIEGWESIDLPTTSPGKEFARRAVATVAQEEFALRR